MNEKQIKLATAEYYDWVTTPPEKYYLLSIEQETFAKEVWMACSEKFAERIDSSVPNGDAAIDVMQNLIENNKPVGYVREWEGDVSDANNFIFVANRDELDDSPNWIEVFSAPQPSDAEAKLAIAIEAIKDYQAKCAKSEPVSYRQTIHCEYKGETKIQYGYSEFQVMKGDTPLYDKPQSSDAEYRLAEAMKILNQIATMPRKTRERNLAYSFVTFIEAMQSEKIVKS